MVELVRVGQVGIDQRHALAVSDDGTRVVLGRSFDPRLELVEVATGAVRAQVEIPGTHGGRLAALTRDGAAVAIGSGGHHGQAHHLFWWELVTGIAPELPTGDVREVRWVAPRADGRYLAAVGRSKGLVVVEVATRAVVFSATIAKLFPRWAGDVLVFWPAQGGRVFRPEAGVAGPASDAELSGRWDTAMDSRGAYEQDGALRLCGQRLLWASGDGEHELRVLDPFTAAAISGDGRTLAVSVGTEVTVWRVQ